MVWMSRPDMTYLSSDESVLTDDRATRIGNASSKAVVFGVGRHVRQRDLTKMGIEFYPIRDAGVARWS